MSTWCVELDDGTCLGYVVAPDEGTALIQVGRLLFFRRADLAPFNGAKLRLTEVR